MEEETAAGREGPQRRLERARALVLRHGWNTMACQILSPAVLHWFSPRGDAVVGYVAAGDAWVVAGAPVCAAERLPEVAAAFEAAAARHGRRVCYFGAQDRLVAALSQRGELARLPIGAQPVWDPGGWPQIVARKGSLRAQIARARNKGLAVSAAPAEELAGDPGLRRCLREWLDGRGLPPMRFLVEPDAISLPAGRRVFVASRGGTALAYLLATPIPRRRGWLVEQIVRGREAPNGTAELLVDAAMRALAAESSYVTLGLAPLAAGAEQAEQQPATRALLAWARAHGRRFYNFSGLHAFKSKLQPDAWEPVYALSRERATSLRTLYAIAAAFAGAPPPVFLARALARAAAQELRWALGRQARP